MASTIDDPLEILHQPECPLCDRDDFSHKQNLSVHLRRNHKLSEQAVEAFLSDIEEAKYRCRPCDKIVGRNYHRHFDGVEHARVVERLSQGDDDKPPSKKRKKEKKSKRKSAKKSKSRKKSRSPSPASEPSEEDANPVESQEEVIIRFKKYVVVDLRDSKNTAQVYAQKVKSFCKFQKESNPAFELGKLVNVLSKSKFSQIPSANDWVNTFDHAPSKAQATNAFKNLIKFIKHCISQVEDRMPKALREERYSYLTMKFDQACNLATKVAKDIEPERRERAREKERIANEDSEDETPKGDYIELKALVDEYRNSAWRRKFYDDLIKTGLARNVTYRSKTKVEVRNFLMFEAYLESGGLRPDVILNLTVQELVNGKQTNDENTFVIVVGEHKTHRQGGARLFVPKELFSLLKEFARELRPLFKPMPDEISLQRVFLSEEGKPISELKDAVRVFTRAMDCPFPVTPMDFRHMNATLGQEHPDADVNTGYPRFMCHSLEIARRNYLDDNFKTEANRKLREKIWKPSENMPDLGDRSEADAKDKQFKKDVNNELRRKKEKEALDKAVATHKPRPRNWFNPSEAKVIFSALGKIVKYNDGSYKRNCNHTHIREAMRGDPDFAAIIERHVAMENTLVGGRNFTEEEVFMQIMHNWAYQVRKLQG
jgi:hypothetical protein